jgi:hypothetical protein
MTSTRSNDKLVDANREMNNAYVNVIGQIPNLCNETDMKIWEYFLRYMDLGLLQISISIIMSK